MLMRLRYIGKTINNLDYQFRPSFNNPLSTYFALYKTSFVHIVVGGKIVKSGDSTLAKETEENGYEKYLK